MNGPVFDSNKSFSASAPVGHHNPDRGVFVDKGPVRRQRHAALKGLDKHTIINEVSIEQMHTAIVNMTNPNDWGYSLLEKPKQPRYFNPHSRQHKRYGVRPINFD